MLIQTITDQYVGYKPAVFGGECTGYISIRGGYRKSKQIRFKIQRYKLNDKKHDELKKLWIFFWIQLAIPLQPDGENFEI